MSQAAAFLSMIDVSRNNKRPGRPKLADSDVTLRRALDAARMWDEGRGESVTRIAALYGVTRQTVHAWLDAAKRHANQLEQVA